MLPKDLSMGSPFPPLHPPPREVLVIPVTLYFPLICWGCPSSSSAQIFLLNLLLSDTRTSHRTSTLRISKAELVLRSAVAQSLPLPRGAPSPPCTRLTKPSSLSPSTPRFPHLPETVTRPCQSSSLHQDVNSDVPLFCHLHFLPIITTVSKESRAKVFPAQLRLPLPLPELHNPQDCGMGSGLRPWASILSASQRPLLSSITGSFSCPHVPPPVAACGISVALSRVSWGGGGAP